VIISISLTLAAVEAYARAGGAGGGGSDFGGGGSGGNDILFDFYLGFFLRLAPALIERGPIGWCFLAVGLYLIFQAVNRLYFSDDKTEWLPERSSNRGFPVDEELYRKIETAFLTVQKSWAEKQTGPMRRFISDGVYQRFHAQFTMMKLLGQTNQISNLKVYSIERIPRPTETEGLYECLDVRIEASAEDQFVSATNPGLNSPGGNERFSEYWSFIRRRDHILGKDIFHSNSCPRCSAPLSLNMMKDARCSYCGSYINNGEFDWVLSEITQEGAVLESRPVIAPRAALATQDPMFSIQVLEDKASNAFMQILIAKATGDLRPLKRFCTNRAYTEFSSIAQRRSRIIYDRLYLKSVVTESVDFHQGLVHATVRIQFASRKLSDLNDTFAKLETETKFLKLWHEPVGASVRGTIYANACSSCGAPQKDSLSPVCEFCRANLNDMTRDWIVDNLD
jgi:predicted lipid-binding transport protein (Tim44 family)